MRGCLQIGVLIVVLAALGIYLAVPHPTRNDAELKAIAAASERLMAAYPLEGAQRYADVPKEKWPPAIAGLKPESVTVYPGMVDITTRPFFDGGWGYGFARNKRNLTMLVECWSELGYGVYWHGPC
jgi:hypothetical protein